MLPVTAKRHRVEAWIVDDTGFPKKAKLRWLIVRDYLELKQGLSSGHHEGRGWSGFHHHGALCIAAYGFLFPENAAIPPRPAEPRS